MTDTKQPEEIFDAAEHFNRLHGYQEKENPKESRPKKPWYQRQAGIERNKDTELDVWNTHIKPIIKEHQLFWNGEIIEYQYFPKPETLDAEGMYLMQRKTMVRCMEVGFPEKGIRKKENEKEPNDPFEGPDDFIKLVIDDLKRKNYGETEIENIEGIKQDLGDIFRLFLIEVLEDKTLPYFLEFIRQETKDVKSSKQDTPNADIQDEATEQDPDDCSFSFYKDCQKWMIGGCGKEGTFNHLKGFEYIHYLIERTEERINIVKLNFLDNVPYAHLHLLKFYPDKKRVTKKDKFMLNSKKIKLEEDLQQITDIIKKEEIQEKINQCKKEMKKVGDDLSVDNFRTNVRNRIVYAIKKIEELSKQHPSLKPLLKHLNLKGPDKSIFTGFSCYYRPPDDSDPVKWNLYPKR